MIFFTHLYNVVRRRMQILSIVFFLMFSLWGQGQPIWQSIAGDQTTATGSSTSYSVAKPANVVAGDLIILVLTQQRSSTTADASSFTPTAAQGFTLIKSETGTSGTIVNIVAYYKIASGSEPTNYTGAITDHGGGDLPNWRAVVNRVTGFNPTTPIGPVNGNNSATTTVSSLAIDGVTTTNANSLIVAAVSVRSAYTAATSPATMTERWDFNGSGTGNNNRPSTAGATEAIVAAGATGTRTFSWTGNATAAGIMFAINPIPGVPVVQPSSFVVGTLTPNKTNSNVPGYGGIYPTDRSYNTFFGRETSEASTGVNRVINSFTVNTGSSAGTYVRGSLGNVPFSKVVVKRETGGLVEGEKVTAFFESAAFPAEVSGAIPDNTNVFLRPEYVGTLPDLINSYIFNRGSDNVFANADATANNVGRIDLIFEGGITASSLAGALNKSGILLIERGANDDFKYAAITSLNAQQEVATLGPLGTAFGTVDNPIWGNTGVNIESMVFQRDANQTGDLRPSQHITSQPIAGTFITLASMGIAAQQVFYGISIFPGDVTTAMNLLTLSGFPTTTPSSGANAGGLDWMAGGGFFTEAVSISGNVWNDVNGNAINSGENLITNGSVWANLVDPSTNDVIQSVVVNNLGSYFFPNITQNAVYKVILTTSDQTGNLNLEASTLPADFVHTGVNLSGVPNTGNQTGVITVNSGETGVANQNFGIQQPPTPGSGTNIVLNPEGTLQVTVPANTFTNTTNSTDVAPGTVTSIRITAFPTGASSIVIGANTYNSNVPAEVAALLLLIIPTDVNGNPGVAISVDPSFGGAGSVTIPFVAIDNAGDESLTTGTAVLTMNCAEYRSITSGLWSVPGNWERRIEPFANNVWEVATTSPPSGALVRIFHEIEQNVDYTVFNCPLILDNIVAPVISQLTINPNVTLGFSETGYDGNAYFNSRPVIVKSTATGTGAIGRMYETGPAIGQYSKTISPGDNNVTLERYIPGTKRRWNLLTFGVTSSTASIRDAWGGGGRIRVDSSQNSHDGKPFGSPPITNPDNVPFPIPGDYVIGDGTIITGHSHTDPLVANGQGFDWWPELIIRQGSKFWIDKPNGSKQQITAGRLVTTPSSIRVYRPAPGETSTFDTSRGVAWLSQASLNTNYNNLGVSIVNAKLNQVEQGYMLYTRGDRKVLENWFNETTLRPTGQINKLVVPVTVQPGASLSVFGNPYPAPINFEQLQVANSTALENYFYYWDSNIPGTQGNGGWRTVNKVGSNWEAVPFVNVLPSQPPPATTITNKNVQYISSSQAVLLASKAAVPVDINVTEEMKVGITTVDVLPFETEPAPASTTGILFANYNARNSANEIILMDGVAVALADGFTTETTDASDIKKIYSFTDAGTSISLMRNGLRLGIEAQPEPLVESVFYLYTTGLEEGTYSLTFFARDLQKEGREIFLRDNFLGSMSPINSIDETRYDFEVTDDVLSLQPNRFEIVFKQATILPVTFTSINAVEQQKDIYVSWAVATEENMSHYEVEHSLNGTEFEKAVKVDAKNTSPASYDWLHVRPGAGTHFYRVRAINKEGRNLTTRIVKVTLGDNTPGFKAFPTVVSATRHVTLQLISLEKGSYSLQVTDMAGRVISARTIEHNGGSASMMLQLPPALSAGKYNVVLNGTSGNFIQPLVKD